MHWIKDRVTEIYIFLWRPCRSRELLDAYLPSADGDDISLQVVLTRHFPPFDEQCVPNAYRIDLSEFWSEISTRLDIIFDYTVMKGVSGDTPLTLCPYLTNLSFTNLVLKKSALQALSTAMSDGKLPRLFHLTFKDCRRLNGRLSILFALPWPNIIYLNMCGTQVSFSDLGVLFRTGTDVDNLPSLTSLELCAVKLFCRKFFHFKLTMSKVTDLILSNELLFGYNFLE